MIFKARNGLSSRYLQDHILQPDPDQLLRSLGEGLVPMPQQGRYSVRDHQGKSLLSGGSPIMEFPPEGGSPGSVRLLLEGV